MVLLARKKQMIVSVEATKGTIETITNADVAILAEDIEYSLGTEEIVRDPLRSTFSKYESIPGAQIATVTCRCEMKGSGIATTAPKWGTLLQGCGFAETINTGDIDYTLKSAEADSETLTIAVYNDGLCYICYGARGNVSFEMNANQVAYMNFTFVGIHSSITDAAMLSTLSYDTGIPPVFKNSSTAFNIDGAWNDAVFSTFTLDLNCANVLREDANATNGLSHAIISDRDPAGSIDLDAVLVAAQAFYTHLTTPTAGSITTTLGTTAGNKVTLTADKLQVLGITNGDRDGVATFNCDFKLRTAGGDDDELTITHE